jgi:tetratricopeptide (TPR) repeat protein
MTIDAARNAMKTGDLNQAQKYLVAALKAQPENPEIHYNLAIVQAQRGHFAAAAEHFLFCLQAAPDNVELLNNTGNAQRLSGRLSEAKDHLDKALRLAPDHVAARCNRGWLNLRNENYNDAINDFKTALNFRDDIEDAWRGLADALIEAKRYQDAQASLEKSLHRFPNSSALHNSQGILYIEGRRPDRAIGHFKQAINLTPENADAQLNHGITSEQLGAFTEAEASLIAALKLRPGHPSTQFHLAQLSSHTATPEEAVAIRRALENQREENSQVDLLFALGKTLAKLDRHEEAFPCFMQARRLMSQMQSFDINRALEKFRKISEAGLHTITEEAEPRYIFVVGMPRSGTTLTDQILASHTEVQSLGESGAVGALLSKLKEQKHFTGSISELPREQRDYLRVALEENLSTSSPTRIVIDTSPDNYPYLGLLAELLPNAKFVHCARNPLDTCVSIIEHPLSRAHAYANSLEDLGSYYLGYQKLMLHWESLLGQRLHTVVYEELLENPEKEIRDLLNHCTLAFEKNCVQFYKTDRPILTPSASQVRKPLSSKSVGRWRVYEQFLTPLINSLN